LEKIVRLAHVTDTKVKVQSRMTHRILESARYYYWKNSAADNGY